MDLFKLLHRFVKFVLCFLALCQTKPSLSLTKISKLVEWVKVLKARCAFGNVFFVSPSFYFLLSILSLPSFSLLSLLSPLCTARPTAKCQYSKQILIMCNCPNATSERLMFANDIFAANEHRFYYQHCHSSTANVAQRTILIPERAAEGKIVKASLRFPFGKNLPHTFASNKLLANWGIQWNFALSGSFWYTPNWYFFLLWFLKQINSSESPESSTLSAKSSLVLNRPSVNMIDNCCGITSTYLQIGHKNKFNF